MKTFMAGNARRSIPVIVITFLALSITLPRADAQFTGSFQTNVISGVISNWFGRHYIVGSNAVFDALIIQNAGALTVVSNNNSFVGQGIGADNNVAVITGTGSVWNSQGGLFVGSSGAGNQLVVSNGGRMEVSFVGRIGFGISASNCSALVTGSGSVWSNRTGFEIGIDGRNCSLVISNGGSMFNGTYGHIGEDSIGTNSTVIVTGSGSVWTNGQDLQVGVISRGNNLAVNGGASVICSNGLLGTRNNRALITGIGSLWKCVSNISFTGDGNSLVISNGGAVVSSFGNIGASVNASNNSVLVTGTGSSWTTNISLFVGENSSGNSLTIDDGGTVGAKSMIIGRNAGSQGTLTMAGGFLNVTNGSVIVGDSGIGQMTVSNGTSRLISTTVANLTGSRGTVTWAGGTNIMTTAVLNVGFNAGTTGAVWMLGGLAVVTNSLVTIGNGGVGQMTVSNGNCQVSSSITVGNVGGSQGTLTIAGGTNLLATASSPAQLLIGNGAPGAVWMTGGLWVLTNATITIGSSGTGQMTVSNGVCSAGSITVAVFASSRGTLTVANTATLAMISPLIVGGAGSGSGTVWVTGGQLVVTNTPATVGAGSGFVIDGSVTLTNRSSINVSNVNTIVGNAGSGSLTVFGGSTLFNDLIVGNLARSRGTITFAGGTNRMTASTAIALGTTSTGTVWITGGLVNPSIAFGFSVGTVGAGQLILSNGTLRSSSITVGVAGGSVGTLTVAGGTWDGPAALTLGDAFNAIGTVWVKGGTVVLTNNSFSNVIGNGGTGRMTVSNGLVSASQMNIKSAGGGAGTLTMAGGTNTVYSDMLLGNFLCTATGVVEVIGGRLDVTNVTGTAVLEVRSGRVVLNSGTLTINKLVITNTCGHFVRTGGTLIYSQLVLDPNLSAVDDGIPNGWKQQYGFDPLDPNLSSGDPDGDGCNNLCEFLAGSNPVADIKAITKEGNNVRITWQAAAGKTNVLERTAGDVSGGFTTNGFAAIFTVTNTAGTVTNYLDEGATTNVPSLYYRVRLVP